MKRYWSTQELREHWSLSVEERSLLAKKTPRSQLGFAVLLKCFQLGTPAANAGKFLERRGVRSLPRLSQFAMTDYAEYYVAGGAFPVGEDPLRVTSPRDL